MAWTYIGGQIETGTTNTPPTGAAAGDLLICEVTNTSSSATVTPPAGWTEISSDPLNSDFSQRVFYRVMQAGDTSWTWTWSTGTQKQVTIAIGGADTTTPVDTSSSRTQSAVNTGTTTAITPAAAGELFVGIWCMDASGTRSWTPDGTMTERIDGGGGTTLVTDVATEEIAGTSSTSRGSTVSGTAQDIGSYGIFLKAAAAGGTPQTIAVGQATETDTAQPVTAVPGALTVSVGQALETDTAQAVTPVLGALAVPVGQAVETDSALHVTVVQAGVAASTPTRTLLGVGT